MRIVSPGSTAVDRAQKHPRGDALKHHRRGLLGRDFVGQLHQPVGVDQPLFGIAADRSGIGDAVAGLHVGDAGPDRFDESRRLRRRA